MPANSDADRDTTAPAGERLRRHLAEHDVKCEECGYNLRGVTTVTCPECGRVIGAPPQDRPAGAMALRCHRCGYTLFGLAGGPCPECGAADVTVGDYALRLGRMERRRVPWLLGTCAAVGAVLLLGRVAMLVYPPPFTPGLSARLTGTMLLGLAMCLLPAALAGFVYLRPGLLRAGGASPKALRGAIVGAAIVALALAAALLVI